MAYAVIQFVEAGERKATLCRPSNGQPTGENGVMDALSAFIEENSPTILRQGSPGALHMAMLFVSRDRDAGQEIRVLGGEGALGITLEQMQALEGQGYFYEAHFGPAGDRSMPLVLQHALDAPRKE
ncbi:MAG TPA: hypothetical protein VHG28_18535 [Longimicrobiaceae bacterium]|nr:hypothetical protein [Longimicrobiaceae bacterium]